MIRAFDLPAPADGLIPVPQTVEFQLRRLNRLAAVLWEHRPQLGNDPAVSFTLYPSSDYAQISIDVRSDRVTARALVARLGWDLDPDVRPVGVAKHHYWHGMLGGFRAYVVCIEHPEPVDTQGRDQLPADVGIGDPTADAAHVRLQSLARAASGMPFRTEGPGQ